MGTLAMMDQGYSPQPGGVLLSNVNYIPPGLEGLFKDPFTYTIVFNNLASGATTTQTAQIQNDSYFVCTQQTMEIFDQATLLVNTSPAVAPMTFRTQDSSSGKFEQNVGTPVANGFGTALQPKVWLYRARLYLPGGQISMELTNGMAAAQRIRVSFEGFKVYKVPDELPTM